MKYLIIILTILLNGLFCFAQNKFAGQYSINDGAHRLLDLRPDYTYIYLSQPPCGVVQTYIDSGVYKIAQDTIYLYSNIQQKLNDKFIYTTRKLDTNFNYWVLDIGILNRVHISDTIVSKNQSGRINDYEFLIWGAFEKTAEYYENGKLKIIVQDIDKGKVITRYYQTGQIQVIEQYKKDKKNGDWFYFEPNGHISKIVKFKIGRKRYIRQNAL